MVSMDFVLHCIANEIMRFSPFMFEYQVEYVVCVLSLLLIGLMVALKFKLFGFQFIAWYFPFYAIGFWGRKYQNLWEKSEHVIS